MAVAVGMMIGVAVAAGLKVAIAVGKSAGVLLLALWNREQAVNTKAKTSAVNNPVLNVVLLLTC